MNYNTQPIVDYLQEEVHITTDALKAYQINPMDDDKRDAETKRLREVQAILYRDRIIELNRHIAVIKRGFS